jgi:hypothetical protein
LDILSFALSPSPSLSSSFFSLFLYFLRLTQSFFQLSWQVNFGKFGFGGKVVNLKGLDNLSMKSWFPARTVRHK